MAVSAACKADRRSRRSRQLLRRAFTEELAGGEDLSRITVAALADRAGLTRRTFYTHYRDIPDFVERLEGALLADIRTLVAQVGATSLPELYDSIDDLEPCPGSVELLAYFKDNHELIGALLGPGGDPAFMPKLIEIARAEIAGRMRTGIVPAALGAFFDYYLTYVVNAEAGVILRWLETGLKESPRTMACVMTVIAFARPGDLYGMPIDINVPAYGLKLMSLGASEREGGPND